MGEREINGVLGTPTEAELEAYLKNIYYSENLPASYAGAPAVYNSVRSEGKYKVSMRRIRDWLRNQNAYNGFKQASKRFKRLRLVVKSKDNRDVDTLNMHYHKENNDGYAYILVCIDILTPHLITRLLKALQASRIKDAFKDIFRYNEGPRTIRSDRGSEFMNQEIKSYFASKGINHFFTNNEVKASYAERVIRMLRQRIGRLFKGRHSFNWVD